MKISKAHPQKGKVKSKGGYNMMLLPCSSGYEERRPRRHTHVAMMQLIKGFCSCFLLFRNFNAATGHASTAVADRAPRWTMHRAATTPMISGTLWHWIGGRVNLKCHIYIAFMRDTFALLPLDRSIGTTVHTTTYKLFYSLGSFGDIASCGSRAQSSYIHFVSVYSASPVLQYRGDFFLHA